MGSDRDDRPTAIVCIPPPGRLASIVDAEGLPQYPLVVVGGASAAVAEVRAVLAPASEVGSASAVVRAARGVAVARRAALVRLREAFERDDEQAALAAAAELAGVTAAR